MSTDQKKPDPSPAAEKLSHFWSQFKQGKLISYRAMAVILLVVAGIGLWLYIRSEKKVGTSKVWYELEATSTESGLTDFVKNNPDTVAARVARLHLARHQLGPDGIAKLTDAKDPTTRQQAVASIGKAQETFAKLAEESADPVIRAECYLGLAKAEAALVGVTKEGSTDMLGSVEKTVEWLDKLAEAADGTPWGEEAKKLAAALKDTSNPVRNELTSVQLAVYRLSPSPAPPGGGPLFPGGSPFGGPFHPPGGSPFGTGGTPVIPGGPVPPPAPDSGTGTGPPLPPPIPPDAKGKEPSAPEAKGKEPSTPVPPKK